MLEPTKKSWRVGREPQQGKKQKEKNPEKIRGPGSPELKQEIPAKLKIAKENKEQAVLQLYK